MPEMEKLGMKDSCFAERRADMALTEQEARRIAEERVYVYMTWGTIQEACREFGIKVVKSRHTMDRLNL